ncbi:hypothetical protein AAKU67_000182 [Oxalobacteraceae bacterium GrIS 2.11]
MTPIIPQSTVTILPPPAARPEAPEPSLLIRFIATMGRDPVLILTSAFAIESAVCLAKGRPGLALGFAIATLWAASKSETLADLFAPLLPE